MLFSQRNGYAAALKSLAPDEASEVLRNSIWNEITEWIEGKSMPDLCRVLWKDYYKKPTDKIPYRYHDAMDGFATAWQLVRDNFFKCEWHQFYDFIEFLLLIDRHRELEKSLTRVLKRELAPYRIVNDQFVQITDQLEIDALVESMSNVGKFSVVSNHFSASLALLSNRTNPDYRNSIKESISGVEAMAKIIAGNSKATLDDALQVIERKHALHGALKKGYQALYGYTSGANGIRHSLMEESNLSQADAKYFLISCSTFVNYLKTFVN